MDGKIAKCEKDLNSLKNTIKTLKGRNEKLKGSLILKSTGKLDEERKILYERRMKEESQELLKSKKHMQNIERNYEKGSIYFEDQKKEVF